MNPVTMPAFAGEAYITGTGAYLPGDRIGNGELAARPPRPPVARAAGGLASWRR